MGMNPGDEPEELEEARRQLTYLRLVIIFGLPLISIASCVMGVWLGSILR